MTKTKLMELLKANIEATDFKKVLQAIELFINSSELTTLSFGIDSLGAATTVKATSFHQVNLKANRLNAQIFTVVLK